MLAWRRFWSAYAIAQSHQIHNLVLCVEVLLPSQPNGVMSSAVSLPNHTFTWFSGRGRMTVENILWSNLHERMLPTRRGLNPQPPDHQSDAHPTEPLRLGYIYTSVNLQMCSPGEVSDKPVQMRNLIEIITQSIQDSQRCSFTYRQQSLVTLCRWAGWFEASFECTR